MRKKTSRTIVLLFLIAPLLLAACGNSRHADLRVEDPSVYYLHVPEGYTGGNRWPLFIALHEVRDDSQDCISEWFEFAEEDDFFLLCPGLSSEGASFDQAENERVLADILNRLYQEYSLRNRFFLAGRGEAASFALRYAYRYPQAIEGVAAIDAGAYPGEIGTASFPVLIIVERGDDQALLDGNAFMEGLGGGGTHTRLLEIDNLGGGIPYGVKRLTIDLFEQVSR